MMEAYKTLDQVTQGIARRSFYDDLMIIPLGENSYLLEDDYSLVGDYPEFIDGQLKSEYEHIGLMEPHESLTQAGQVRLYARDMLAALEAGQTVRLAYTPVFAFDVVEEDDNIIGWTICYEVSDTYEDEHLPRIWDDLIMAELFTEGELETITNIMGDSLATIHAILEARYGTRSLSDLARL